MNIKSKLSVLIQLANIDGDFAGKERDQIYLIGKANGYSKAEVDELIVNPEPLPPIGTMTEDEKFELLYHLVQLMKIDSSVYKSEIQFCESLAVKLGYKKKVIAELSSRIYSDPAITTDISVLKKIMKKYQ